MADYGITYFCRGMGVPADKDGLTDPMGLCLRILL